MNNQPDTEETARIIHYTFFILILYFFIYGCYLRRQPYNYCKQAQR